MTNFFPHFADLFLVTSQGMKDLSSLTRDQTHAFCSGSADSTTGGVVSSLTHV